MWKNRSFRRLWLANTISSFGTQITLLALPLTAITLLQVSPVQLGILAACGTLPYLLIGLPAGVWVDRLRRRPILLMADVGRAILLALIPLLVVMESLQSEHLYFIAFLTGTLSLFYDLAEEAYLPVIVGDEALVEGNSQLAAIDATAELTAPVVAGGLVQLLTAPFAIAVDAASFLWSALWLGSIQQEEARPAQDGKRQMWEEIKEGMAFLTKNPILRSPLLTGIQWQLFGGMNDALLILFLTEALQLPPTAIGLMYAVGSLSGLIATRLSNKITKRVGPGPVTIGAATLLGTGWLIVSLSIGTSWAAFIMVAAGMVLAGSGNMVWNVTTTSVTQTITPNRLLGRVNASDRFLTWGALPLGALIGGFLAEQWGVRPALVFSCSGIFFGMLWVWFSPLRTLSRFPSVSSAM